MKWSDNNELKFENGEIIIYIIHNKIIEEWAGRERELSWTQKSERHSSFYQFVNVTYISFDWQKVVWNGKFVCVYTQTKSKISRVFVDNIQGPVTQSDISNVCVIWIWQFCSWLLGFFQKSFLQRINFSFNFKEGWMN